jgi:hypothetical protein
MTWNRIVNESDDAQMNTASILFGGDAYKALFYLPRGSIFLKGVEGASAQVMPVGTEYIRQAVEAVCNPQRLLEADINGPSNPYFKQFPGNPPFYRITSFAWYQVRNAGLMPAHYDSAERLPLLHVSPAETEEVSVIGLDSLAARARASRMTSRSSATELNNPHDVIVHWLGELARVERKKNRAPPGVTPPCKVHVQVGLTEPLQPVCDKDERFRPHLLADPELGRILVVNIGEMSGTHRVRRSLSYEAVAVDLLRFLRGDGAKPKFNDSALNQLSMLNKQRELWTALAVRINNSAVFLYALERGSEHAWIFCHNKECAPLAQPELGQMVGYTGFVSTQLTAAMASFISTRGAKTKLCDVLTHILQAIRRSLLWQRVAYERGCLYMLVKPVPDFPNCRPERWQMNTSGDYKHMFQDIVATLNKKRNAGQIAGNTKSLENRISQFDGCLDEIIAVNVDIKRAVAHRTQWFMARSVEHNGQDQKIRSPKEGGRPNVEVSEARDSDEQLKRFFFQTALSWLSKTGRSPVMKHPNSSQIPIVAIGQAELTDRREIEDFLAICHALTVYAKSMEKRPLNVAVFGGPGSGKSFAIKQVVKHIGDSKVGRFSNNSITFNLGQFKTLDDLPAALHLVRNESLSGEIPIVFFDEFDSSFNGEPFGWLKYFLAPMQDGEFYHAGQNYKVGSAVFVFAGGVNRTFEELNGRVRNPGFCEAKGPDFISRLRAHLNIQGINKAEDDADQYRYILKRGILIRSLVREKLGLREEQKSEELLHQTVAGALLSVDRFKHGVRSLEAIIKMCSTRPGYPIGPSDLPSMDQLEMHVDAAKLLKFVDETQDV